MLSPAPQGNDNTEANKAITKDVRSSPFSMNTQALYGFNIEEVYDYDLPNIRKPSTTLTAMSSSRALGGSTKGLDETMRSSGKLAPLEGD